MQTFLGRLWCATAKETTVYIGHVVPLAAPQQSTLLRIVVLSAWRHASLPTQALDKPESKCSLSSKNGFV